MDAREGLYVSFDWCATKPILVTSHPSAMLAWVSWVSPDPDVFGRVFVGTSCAGVTQVNVIV
jgi:hypothetical protein